MSDVHPDDALRDELVLLRAEVAKQFRAQIAKPDASPALLEAARKFLSEQLQPEKRAKAPPVTLNLPFPAPD